MARTPQWAATGGTRMVTRISRRRLIVVDMRTQCPTGLMEEQRTHSIIGAFFEVYNYLGYGFVEKVYVAALERELVLRRHIVRREVAFDVAYKGAAVARHRIDLLVDDSIILELKASTELPRSATQQLKSYLGASPYEVGLLFHFGPTPRFVRLVFTNDRKQHLLRNAHQRRSVDSDRSALKGDGAVPVAES